MPKHVYPAWHKTAQRAFFLVGAVLCITLPVAYGKHRSISSKVLGAVLGVFFALWLLFSVWWKSTHNISPPFRPSVHLTDV